MEEVPADGIAPFAEEGAEIDPDTLPTFLLKDVEITTGVLSSGIEVVVAVLTLIDPEAWAEAGILVAMASEDGLKFSKALKSVSATVSPSYKQAARRQEESE